MSSPAHLSYKTSFLEAIKVRRSILSLAKESPISDEWIISIVKHAIKYAPSPFHVQSCRAIVLFGADHEKLWDFGRDRTKASLPPQVFETFAAKIQGFHDAYGTVLFFEDSDAVKALPPPLQDTIGKNPEWYEHSNGMHQFIVWTALATEGLGCNLQHLQQFFNKDVTETWKVPESWNLRAQLVFGKPTGPPRGGVDKVFAPIEGRVEVYGSKQ